jgi:hypothetical protein
LLEHRSVLYGEVDGRVDLTTYELQCTQVPQLGEGGYGLWAKVLSGFLWRLLYLNLLSHTTHLLNLLLLQLLLLQLLLLQLLLILLQELYTLVEPRDLLIYQVIGCPLE